ncbi:hypothetical protein D1871_11185 [Nakamurella silvestris]|nr:hypothetical protein D1871_11185 [Nakamurella silvestris]
MSIAPYRKAVTTAVATTAAAAGAFMADGSFTVAEAVMSVGAGLTAAAATYLVPNAPDPRPGRHAVNESDKD